MNTLNWEFLKFKEVITNVIEVKGGVKWIFIFLLVSQLSLSSDIDHFVLERDALFSYSSD
jgi:hypothetical protein